MNYDALSASSRRSFFRRMAEAAPNVDPKTGCVWITVKGGRRICIKPRAPQGLSMVVSPPPPDLQPETTPSQSKAGVVPSFIENYLAANPTAGRELLKLAVDGDLDMEDVPEQYLVRLAFQPKDARAREGKVFAETAARMFGENPDAHGMAAAAFDMMAYHARNEIEERFDPYVVEVLADLIKEGLDEEGLRAAFIQKIRALYPDGMKNKSARALLRTLGMSDDGLVSAPPADKSTAYRSTEPPDKHDSARRVFSDADHLTMMGELSELAFRFQADYDGIPHKIEGLASSFLALDTNWKDRDEDDDSLTRERATMLPQGARLLADNARPVDRFSEVWFSTFGQFNAAAATVLAENHFDPLEGSTKATKDFLEFFKNDADPTNSPEFEKKLAGLKFSGYLVEAACYVADKSGENRASDEWAVKAKAAYDSMKEKWTTLHPEKLKFKHYSDYIQAMQRQDVDESSDGYDSRIHWRRDADDDHAQSVARFTNQFDKAIRASQFSDLDDPFREEANEIEEALVAAPKRPGKVYRGLTVAPNLVQTWLDQIKSGDAVITLGALSSTSRDELIARNFDGGTATKIGVLFHINQQTGVDISSKSTYAMEKETLMSSKARFRISSFDKRSDKQYDIFLDEISPFE